MHPDALIARVAESQHSLITLEQLRSVGLSKDQIDGRVRRGRLVRLEPRLFKVGGAVETWEQRVLGACLSAGPQAAACRRTAAVLWGLTDITAPPIEIAVPRPRSPQWVSAKVFRSTDLIAAHRMELNRIPVTNVPRTLVDLGAVAPDWMVESAVDRAVTRKLVTIRELRATLDNVARQGRRGVGPLRRVLENVHEGPESVLEMKLVRLILRSTLPRPQLQFWVEVDGSLRFRLDIAYPEAMLAIEADGREVHSRRDVFSADRERQAALEDLGWRFLRFTWHHVTQRESWVISRIRDVYRARLQPTS
ncbi:MAG: DUF559 domain-containing protein [Actinobacteria bacterium]|nr:DUF559 domain-containing protein [Actinomycetota bacterium]